MNNYPFNSFAGVPNTDAEHQVVTVSNVAATLATLLFNLSAHTRFVRISTELADIRYVFHGATPPSPGTNFGEILYDGDGAILSRAQVLSALFIRNAATDAKLQVSQFTA